MNYLSRIYKRKKRQFLILSASSIHIGLECVYLEVVNTKWQILHNQSIHYPQTIKNLIQKIFQNTDYSLPLKDLAQLDNRMTLFLIDSAHEIVSHIPKIKSHLDLVILKKFLLWKGVVNKKQKPNYWNIHLGDAQTFAHSMKTPVLTDFIRKDILQHGAGNLHTSEGDLIIAELAGDIAFLLNIGLTSHITAIDSLKSKIIIDSDTGPGTYLIDLAAQEAGCSYGFDRDGVTALSGNVKTKALEILLTDKWFKQPAPKYADIDFFSNLFRHQCLKGLSAADKISTLTAFTALTISNFYKREYSYPKKPEVIWLSGGGTYNQALVDFLNAYFSPITVKPIKELGIPNNSRLPLSLGLTVQACLNQQQIINRGGKILTIEQLGNWVSP